MRQRPLGNNGILVSSLGLGTSTWGFSTDKEDGAKQLRTFVDAGGTLVDTANIYGGGRAEQIVGELIGKVVARADIVLATKGGAVPGKPPFKIDVTKAGLLAQIDNSLRNLGTDYVDLYQVHWWDPNTPVEETLSGLDEIMRSGRARAVGVSNYSGWQTALAGQIQRTSGVKPLSTVQVEYSLVARQVEREVVPAAQELGIGILPWAPLGRGILTGKYRGGVPEERRTSNFFKWYVVPRLQARRTESIVETVVDCAEQLRTTPAAVALRWVRDQPGVVAPLIGARTHAQLLDSLKAEDLELPAEIAGQLDKVSAISIGYPERFGPQA